MYGLDDNLNDEYTQAGEEMTEEEREQAEEEAFAIIEAETQTASRYAGE